MATPQKYSLLEAKAKLEALCAYQERCAQELTQKLFTWGFHTEDQDILIADLISNNFLNEERFAEAYASGKFNIKKWGRLKIKAHLKHKNISDYSIKKGLNNIEEEAYITTIEDLIDKKIPSLKGNAWEQKGKLKNYLYQKGYENELINEIIHYKLTNP
ncbi:hypothetical protein DNU06_11865 [Putridiphycobacter roseus]|uniref:Regulatory protein RecX n=1 Tax=Putridiphycobacter roseus TaxID=2219161 RepID=A0A2W1NEQ9_9FLAO|nr:regulatory protein RecX [Putridiphycobacter roseus]PZE16546.1 hypothetical protein DNU06_11865 [Putridiphycobacter roseus]